MEELKELKKYEENQETLITLYIYYQTRDIAINFIQKEINKVTVIQNLSKKKKIHERLYKLKEKFEKMDENIDISSIYFLSNEIYEYKFRREDEEIFFKYDIKHFYIKKDIIFQVDYIINLLTDFEFNYSCKIEKNNIILKIINSTKNKNISNYKFLSEKLLIENLDKIINEHKINELLVYGYNKNIKCLLKEKNNKLLIIEEENINNENISNFFIKRKYSKNNELLEKKLNEMNNEKTNIDLFVFGKLKQEILKSIEYYQLKELYIEEKKIDKLKKLVDDSYLNFKIIPIKSLEKGDIADNFINNYKGLMGIKYY